MRRDIRAIVFDLDDTLVSFSANGDFWADAFAAHGPGAVPIHLAAFQAAIARASALFWSEPERAVQGRLELVWARREVAAAVFHHRRDGQAFLGLRPRRDVEPVP